MTMCSSVLSSSRLTLSAKKLMRSLIVAMLLARAHGVRHRCSEHDQHVGDQRQRDRQQAGGDELGVGAGLDRAEDRRAEPERRDERGDGGERDRRDRGDADAGDDRRHRERQLDARSDWRRVRPMPSAASLASAGTSRSPVSVLRNRISSV